jgi:alkanesulfonate monooxygenase SsuD/methylene tetrahydromethanopterin reductase-like flavin-dependent oxidoreductase (luciferase family)
MPHTNGPRFGVATAPQQVSYDDILRVWREADAIAEIEHAWLFDHLLPIGGDPNGPIFEGWTLLSALAAQTERLRLGLRDQQPLPTTRDSRQDRRDRGRRVRRAA